MACRERDAWCRDVGHAQLTKIGEAGAGRRAGDGQERVPRPEEVLPLRSHSVARAGSVIASRPSRYLFRTRCRHGPGRLQGRSIFGHVKARRPAFQEGDIELSSSLGSSLPQVIGL